jgi:hypothetical protein
MAVLTCENKELVENYLKIGNERKTKCTEKEYNINKNFDGEEYGIGRNRK